MAKMELGQEAFLVKLHAHLEKIYGFSPEKRAYMLDEAGNTLLEYFAKGEDAMARNDLGDLSRVAHSIKGSLAGLGLTDLASLAERIEKQQAGSTDNKEEMLRRQFVELRNSLSAWLG